MLDKVCSRCGGPRIKRLKIGLVTECDACGRETEADRDVRRHVGLQGGGGINKSGNIGIFKNASPALAALVARTNSGGYNANTGLGIGSSTHVYGVDYEHKRGEDSEQAAA